MQIHAHIFVYPLYYIFCKDRITEMLTLEKHMFGETSRKIIKFCDIVLFCA